MTSTRRPHPPVYYHVRAAVRLALVALFALVLMFDGPVDAHAVPVTLIPTSSVSTSPLAARVRYGCDDTIREAGVTGALYHRRDQPRGGHVAGPAYAYVAGPVSPVPFFGYIRVAICSARSTGAPR